MSRKLIVNADDFGLTSAINTGIVEAHRKGIVTSTSMVAGGRAFEEACQLARENSGLDLGVHLTLDEEVPVSVTRQVPSLVGSDGKLHPRGRLIARLLRGKIAIEEVEAEWSAQIKKCLDRGMAISHLDSHGHIHAFPSLLAVAEKLRSTFQIPAMRKPGENVLVPGGRAGAAGYVKKVLVDMSVAWSFGLRGYARGHWPDHFLGLAASGSLDKESFWHLMERTREGVNELMTHPGHADRETIERYGYWGYHWEEELDALKLSEVERERLRVMGVDLTSYKQEYVTSS